MTSSGLEPSRASSSEALSLVGRVLSERYRIESLLGEGGMGAVYLAEHVLMRKRFAVKVLHAEMTRMPEMVARFEREAMAAAHIEHPNVAAATDFGKLENGAFFLVLEYIEGTSLRDVIDRDRSSRGAPCTSRIRSPPPWRGRRFSASSTAISSPRTSCSS